MNIVLRPSVDEDVPTMLEIYSYHIQHGLGDFKAEPLHLREIKRRRKVMLKRRLPHLVADHDGRVIGYAFAAPFRKRPAYRYTLKHSIYIHSDYLHAGIGRQLLPALVDACAAAGYLQLIGYIDGTNEPSLKLHEACGFHQVGLLRSVGFKFGHWTDSVMMQRSLGPGDSVPPGAWPAGGQTETEPGPVVAKPS